MRVVGGRIWTDTATDLDAKFSFMPGMAFVGDAKWTNVHGVNTRLANGNFANTSGNIVTEDFVFMLEAMGLRTGIDIEGLLSVRKILKDTLPQEEMYGFVPEAGLPLGFRGKNGG